MIVSLKPKRVAEKGVRAPTIKLNELVLNIDGIDYDLSVIPEGAVAEDADPPFLGTTSHEEVTIEYPYSTVDIYENFQPKPIESYAIELLDGQTLECPLVRRPTTQEPTA